MPYESTKYEPRGAHSRGLGKVDYSLRPATRIGVHAVVEQEPIRSPSPKSNSSARGDTSQHTFERALQGVETCDFIDSACNHFGRERSFLAQDARASRLIDSLRGLRDLAPVEQALDRLFSDLRKGEQFAHTEVVMALLFALSRTQPEFFMEVANLLSRSTAAELDRLRHFARQLKLST